MGSIFRIVVTVLAGMLVATGIIAGFEWVNLMLHPLPPGLDPNNAAQMEAYAAQLPTAAFLVVLAGWTLGTLAGAFAATRLGPGRRIGPGIVVGVMLLSSTIAAMRAIPHPTFMWVGAFLLLPLSTYLGIMLGSARQARGAVSSGKLF